MSAGYWEELERPAPDAVGELRVGTRICLRPAGQSRDILDLALAGRAAVIEAIEQDLEGNLILAVVVEDDPGRDLGFARQPGHRFFFSPDEVEPLPPSENQPQTQQRRILVAGIGNVFLGDDGFGVALADRLSRRELPSGVEVVDFGIRGLDLAYAMHDGYDAVVLLDATPRGERPGTLYVIEGEHQEATGPALDPHGMDPVKVIELAKTLTGAPPPPTFVVGCEPHTRMSSEDEEIVAQLSEPVRTALTAAETLVESLLADLGAETHHQEAPRR